MDIGKQTIENKSISILYIKTKNEVVRGAPDSVHGVVWEVVSFLVEETKDEVAFKVRELLW